MTKQNFRGLIKPQRLPAPEEELPRFWVRLDANHILYTFYVSGRYWVRIAEDTGGQEHPTNLDIRWSARQQTPFWEGGAHAKETLQAIRKFASGITKEQIDLIVNDFRNACAAGDIPEIVLKKKPKKTTKTQDAIAEELPGDIEITPEERKAAEEFLKNQDLHAATRAILGFEIVGEAEMKSLTFYSGLGAAFEESVGIILSDPSAIGKSCLLGGIANLFPKKKTEQPTSFSEKVLNYLTSDYRGKILRVDEIYGAEEGMADLRVWMSEGRLERWISVSTDESGAPQFERRVVEGAPVFLTSTTQTLVDEQLLTRCWLCFMDPSEEQTKRIHDLQAKRAAYPKFVFEEEGKQTDLLRAAIRYIFLNAKPVLIPWADHIEFPAKNIRARRDYQRFLKLIKSVALWHMLQRPIIKAKDGEEYILATPKDFELAYEVALPFLETTLAGIDRTAMIVVQKIKENFGPEEPFNCSELTKKCADVQPKALDSRTVRRKLNMLEERGVVIADKSKRPFVFEISSASCDTPAAQLILRPFSKKEASVWLDEVCGKRGGEGDNTHPYKKEEILDQFISGVCIGTTPPHVPNNQTEQEKGEKTANGGQDAKGMPHVTKCPPQSPKEGPKVLVEFTFDFPETVAPDGKSIGPFEAGAIARLDSIIAGSLIRKGIARRV